MKKTNREENSSIVKKITKLAIIGLFVLVLLSVTRGVFRLSTSGGRVREAQEKLEEVKKTQSQLSGELEMVKSDYYREKQTRDKLGMAKEGEIVVVLPDEEVLKRLSPRRVEKETNEPNVPNWKKWAKLFFEI